ncbi:MAG: DUF3566 domain-containing protein [Acidobacteriota bacterium]|nr:DUF3566 domain-containing protein [Acidobacteriota bacterium]NLI85442.1 DUF3566 domain-containing protein [Propionibacterium sp.]
MSDDRETVSVPTTPSSGDQNGRLQTEVRQEDAPTAVNPVVTEPVAEATAAAAAAVTPEATPAPAVAKPAAGAVPTRPRTGRVRTAGGTVRPARKARLRVARLDPWSVMKVSLMFSIAVGIIIFVAVALLWSVIEASGALQMLQDTLNALLGNPDGTGTVQVSAYIDRWRVLGFTAIVAGINVILLTALATLGAFLYNLSSSVLGGLEVTLAED